MTAWDDLPPHVQRAIRAGKATAPKRPPKRQPELPLPPEPRADDVWADPSHRCRDCGRLFKAWGPAERHVNAAHGGGVVQLLWPGRAPQGAKLVGPQPPQVGAAPCP